ncbi:MAG: SDR family oxidoreductase [Actinobacteria bacterium]|nr:SDR family oxidoreductase [Actinomycetota bacterium]
MSVLVTGAGGYIGTVLVPLLLEKGHQVIALDRFFFGRDNLQRAIDGHQVEIIRDDIRWFDPNILEGVDAVIDLAALSNDPAGELDEVKTREINHQARAKIAKLAKERGVKRYILPSSCSIYGFRDPDEAIDETYAPNPLTAYARANLAAENDSLPLANDKFTVVALRQSTVYGLSPRMRFDLAINGMVMGFFRGGKIPILRDGTQWRPFVHVKDTSRALIAALEADSKLVNGQIFNVGANDDNVMIFELAERAAKAIGVPFKYEWYGLPDHRSYRVTFDKISNTLGFKTSVSIEEGAQEIYKALVDKVVDPDDMRTITVKWYKHLMYMQDFLKETEVNGVIL